MKNKTPDLAAAVAAQFLTFHLAEELFAIDIRTVREIIQFGPLPPCL